MHFRNFLAELKDILKRGSHIQNFQIAWKKAIIKEINHALYIGGDSSRGRSHQIVKMWAYLIKQEEEKKEQVGKVH